MKPDDFQIGACGTEPSPDDFNDCKDMEASQVRILHAAMGLCTESGELMDQVKKHLFYGAPLDEVNLLEEAGDILWYMAILLDELGYDFEECMKANHDKLAKRYGEKFSSDKALHRDLDAERDVLEGKET